MLCVAYFRCCTANRTPWVLEFYRFKEGTAAVALVTAGIFKTAFWTCSVYIAVSKVTGALRAVKLFV